MYKPVYPYKTGVPLLDNIVYPPECNKWLQYIIIIIINYYDILDIFHLILLHSHNLGDKLSNGTFWLELKNYGQLNK